MRPTIYQCGEAKPAGSPAVLRQELYRADHHDFNLVHVDPNRGKPPPPL